MPKHNTMQRDQALLNFLRHPETRKNYFQTTDDPVPTTKEIQIDGPGFRVDAKLWRQPEDAPWSWSIKLVRRVPLGPGAWQLVDVFTHLSVDSDADQAIATQLRRLMHRGTLPVTPAQQFELDFIRTFK